MTGYSLRKWSPQRRLLNITRLRAMSTAAAATGSPQAGGRDPQGTARRHHPRHHPGRRRDAGNSLHNVTHALFFGAGLTIFVVYAFLNSWRSTLITALSLPTSVLAAFIAVQLMGFSLNFMQPARPLARHRRADRRRHRRAGEHRAAYGARQ